jgi:SNF2 family DNA or RNA helicase
MEQHRYGIELDDNDPLAAQPEKIKTPLKPHQLASLAKAIRMERDGTVPYEINEPIQTRYRPSHVVGRFNVTTNTGVIADIVGYGKTLTSLAIIAATPSHMIHWDKKRCDTWAVRSNVGQCRIEYDRPAETLDNFYIRTTLVVVPRGPVFIQWVRTLQQTQLKYLALDSLPQIRRQCPPEGADFERIKAFFESYDVVLVKNTSLKTLISYYAVPFREPIIVAWDRIMIDEAHDIINTVPFFRFRFLWLITATFQMLNEALHRTSRNIVDAVRDIINEERVHYMLLRGKREFVQQSFDIPQPVEYNVMCALPREFAGMHGFFTPALLERVNAGDFAGVITSLGGTVDTEDNIVDLLTRDLLRDIRNKEREIEFIQSIDVDEATRTQRLTTLNAELTRMQDKLQSLRDRVTQLHEKSCSICYDTIQNPIFLSCTHIYCAQCLVGWLRTNVVGGHKCPTCRAPIAAERLIAVVNQAPVAVPEAGVDVAVAPLSKEETIIQIIRSKPTGRFLVFSSYDYLFYRISAHLSQNNIEALEMKGSTPQMMKILERFNTGELRVILINTHHAASGIEITKATDVIIAHSMGLQAEQCIGRAQRTGRTEPLHIHRLYYPHEMETTN